MDATKSLIEETLNLMKEIDEHVEALSEGKWIAAATKNKGALHRKLGIPQGKKIPKAKLQKAAHAGGKEGKEGRLALTLGKLRKKK